jgi:membrane fusion protein, multidrug efflux system
MSATVERSFALTPALSHPMGEGETLAVSHEVAPSGYSDIMQRNSQEDHPRNPEHVVAVPSPIGWERVRVRVSSPFTLLITILSVAALAGCSKSGESAADETTPTVVSVQTGVLKLVTLHRYVTGYGTIEPAPATTEQPAASAQLASPSAGVVTKVNVVEGQQVAKGDVLVELNSGAMTVENAQQELTRQKQLYAQQNTSLKNLQSAEAQLALLQVTAPLSGTVARINVKPGQAVDLTTVVAEVMDLNRLAVSAAIPAAEAGDLKPGNLVEILTEPTVTTVLSFVSPSVDKDNGTILVRALLPAGGALRPGQFVPLRIVTAVHTNCLAAPAESVVTDENGKSVIARINGDEATQTPVQTGLRENDWVEIAGQELNAGDVVVTVGAYGLPEKTKIQVTNPNGVEQQMTNP